MSAEGAWDMAMESHAHSDYLAHQVDADDHGSVDPDPLSDGDGSQCGDLCHGHMSSITGDSDELLIVEHRKYFIFDSALFASRAQLPPTPPPNA